MSTKTTCMPGSNPGLSPHILTLTPFYPTDSDDSSGCFVFEPLPWLQKLGFCQSVYAIQPIYRNAVKSGNVKVPAEWFRYFSLPGGVGLSTAGAFAFARIVGKARVLHRQHPIHLIHAHGALPCGHAAMLLGRELGIPFVVSVHGIDVFSTVQVGGYAGTACRRISGVSYRASRRVICVSERVREEVLAELGRSVRTSVVYNGADPALFSPSKEPHADEQIVLAVGNLIPTKGHETLIRAIASLTGEFPGLTLEIIGKGPEETRLRALSAELHVREKVRFLGVQSRRQVADAMRHCTVFALPSRYEGLGCVYLEAMSTEKPAIGCRGQGIAEIIQQGSNGFLVGPDNEKELSLALAMVLRDEYLRRQVGSAAREAILHGFTLAHQAERLARIYRECIA